MSAPVLFPRSRCLVAAVAFLGLLFFVMPPSPGSGTTVEPSVDAALSDSVGALPEKPGTPRTSADEGTSDQVVESQSSDSPPVSHPPAVSGAFVDAPRGGEVPAGSAERMRPLQVRPGLAGMEMQTQTYQSIAPSLSVSPLASRPLRFSVATRSPISPEGSEGLRNTYTVTSRNDSGAGSLRQAILDANANPGSDRITFNISGSSPFTITTTSALPEITDPVEIDGTSQPGFAGTPIVVIDGVSAGSSVWGLVVLASGTTLRSLAVQRFSVDGITLVGSSDCVVTGCYLGVGADGVADRGNTEAGISLWGSGNSIIGGSTPAERNVISGNDGLGIVVSGAGVWEIEPAVNYDAGNGPNGVALGDFDGDLDRDLLVANGVSNNVSVLLGNGDGTFAARVNYAAGSVPKSVALGDVDGDHDLDIVVANQTGNNVSVLRNNGNGTFGAAVNYPAGNTPLGVALGDLDGDLDLDIVVADYNTDCVSVLKGNGDGTFQTLAAFAAGDGPHGVALGDLDGDLDLDIAVANGLGDNVSVLRGNGNGTFAAAVHYAAGDAPYSLALGDLDADGDLDIAVADYTPNNDNVSILLGNGDGLFAAPAHYHADSSPTGIALGDLDGSGTLDLAVGNYASDDLSLFLGTGDGTFADVGNLTVGDGPESVTTGDVNGDANSDVAVGNYGSDNASIVICHSATSSSGSRICGNYIGVTATGNASLGNDGPGILLQDAASDISIGGTQIGAGNVISENTGEYGDGIEIAPGCRENSILGNYIGTGADGATDLGNARYGILVVDAPGNVIGGTTEGERNVISGNEGIGVLVADPGSTGNRILGNFIGLDAAGMAALGNAAPGVVLTLGATGTTIGGAEAGAGNVISGNMGEYGDGIEIQTGCSGNSVLGNYIGTGADGTTDLGNSRIGVLVQDAPDNVIGGATETERNVISGNDFCGVYVRDPGSASSRILGNYIGLNTTGTAALGNAGPGVELRAGATSITIGGSEVGARNVISGNTGDYGDGIEIGPDCSGNSILGNYIGTGADGATSLGNVRLGIGFWDAPNNVIGGLSDAERNVISGNGYAGIYIDGSLATGGQIRGNYIGLAAAGGTSLGNDGVGISLFNGASAAVIGGTVSGSRNVISGNHSNGIYLDETAGSGNQILGNYIGLDAAGTADRGNSGDGVYIYGAPATVIGGTSAGAGNVISGNELHGIGLESGSGHTVQGNTIGLNAAGTAAIRNTWDGIWLGGGTTQNTIGGTSAAAANTIAGNGAQGVRVLDSGTVSNAILGNAIHSNSQLGIELGGDGVPTPNDAGDPDTGPNDLQNYPVLTSVTTTGAQGTLNSTPLRTFRVEFFSSDASDASGFGEGQRYLGSTSVTTNTSGDATFNVTFATPAPDGSWVSATATDPSNNTSEFAHSQRIGGTSLVVVNTNDSGAGSLRQAMLDANSISGPDRITFNIPGTPPFVIAPTSILPTITGAVEIDGTSQPGFGGTPIIVLDGVNAGSSVSGLRVSAAGTTLRALGVQRFSTDGIALYNPGSSTVVGCYVGIGADGTTGRGNTRYGVYASSPNNTLGSTASAERNVISSNGSGGIWIQGSSSTGNRITGNYIGLNAAGTAAVGNGGAGVTLWDGVSGNTIGGGVEGAGNVISGNTGTYGDGIELSTGATGNVIQGNRIGVGADGVTDLGNARLAIGLWDAPNNVIGGTSALERNVLSGNGTHGIYLDGTGATGNQIRGNHVGLDITGMVRVSNSEDGIRIHNGSAGTIIGGTEAGARNVISANGGYGIYLYEGGGNVIQGNYIGTDGTGGLTGGNSRDGIFIGYGSDLNAIGGNEPGAGNLIAANGYNGVRVMGMNTGNAILGNSIYANTRLGIDLLGDSVPTPNDPGDPDTGPNNLQNFPVLTSATTTDVQGTLNSTAQLTFRIEFFSNGAADGSGYGEGQQYLGYTTVTTNSSGDATFSATFTTPAPSGSWVSATATDPGNNTSEFSACLQVTAPAGYMVVGWGANESGQCDAPAPNAGFVAIAGGGTHSLGLKNDGSIVAWGLNDYGQCNVPEPNADFVAVAAGAGHSLGLKSDGSIVAWGRNNCGQCTVPSPNTGFQKIAAGWWHSLGLKSDGSIAAWGQNDYHQCNVPAPNTDFVAMDGGGHHSIGLKSGGSVVVWGRNQFGQSTPPSPNSGFAAVSAGIYHNLGLKDDESIVAWGCNVNGECNVPSPNSGFAAVAGGGSHSLALRDDGTIEAWGYNGNGECDVPEPNSDFVVVAGGSAHSLALQRDLGQAIGPNLTPTGIALIQNRPNPFSPSTTFQYGISEAGPVQLLIYDIQGRLVRTLVSRTTGAGWHTCWWDGRAEDGRAVASGVYFCRLQVAGHTVTRKMNLAR